MPSATIPYVANRLRAGDRLHMQIVDGKRLYWFEAPFLGVPESIFLAVLTSGEVGIVEAGDSLFGLRNNSQTWLVAQEYAEAP